jgi:type VI protein secretion system component VasK
MDNRSTKNEGIQANTVKADVIAVGQNAHAEQHLHSTPDSTPQETLDALMAQLKDVLAQLPTEQQEDAQVVEVLADELVQTSQQEVANPKLLEIKGEGLKKAAENLAAVAPIAVQIAGQIVTGVLNMAR